VDGCLKVFDIHYHLLFGVDDGPKTFEDSLALAEASIAEGVTHIVCTPHSNDTYKFQPDVNREKMEMLQERLGDRVTLGLGCDFHLSYDNIDNLFKDRARYTINSKQYLLVEFPDFGIAANMATMFFQMTSSGVVPIITHPERNPTLMKDQKRIAEWIRMGCYVQITAASLLGRFGKRSQAMSHDLLKRNWVHIVASDAHSVERRSPSMARAYETLLTQYGKNTADRLCIENPRAVFLGEDLAEQPEPLGVYGVFKSSNGGFLSKLFGK
jgi:protein-tyrosine phosphatase